jgi:CRISPR-associated helicase Cas3/CRISPR-associated endonuclease Cas3-HD
MDLRKYWAKGDGTTIEQHNQKLLEALDILKQLDYMDEEIYLLAKKACIMHDYGKSNISFQKRVRTKGEKFDPESEVMHNVLSLFFINKDEFEYEEDYYRVAHAVINHHNYGDVYRVLEEKKEFIAKLLEAFPTYTFKRKHKKMLENVPLDKKTILIKGFLHKCDYSASGRYQVEYPNDFLEESLENLLEEWKKKNPLSEWNALQDFCCSRGDENIIAIAQTGMGKTEAGLHWIGNHKGYFVLPLRTAINAIYDRIREKIIGNEKTDSRIAILHSEALEYYLDNLSDDAINTYEYYKKGKNWSIPLNISTMDQLFDFVFQYQGYELNLTTLAYSKIVIDEIQMYDPALLAYLITGLEKISELGGKIAILTATLPPFIKEKLKKNISFEEENEEMFIDELKRHNIKVLDSEISIQDVLCLYKENQRIGKSNKILVVCNTIRIAQKFYDEMKAELKQDDLHILHSRFIKKDRKEKEKEILEFGKTYTDSQKLDYQSGIWISTSLVEASLDIDFDYLFTELQELSSLFQRFGRCNRKGVKNIEEANCFVYCNIDKKTLTENKGFIDSKMYELSKEAIMTVDGILSEKKKVELIDTYLTSKNLKDSDYMRQYKEIYEEINGIEPYKYKKSDIRLRNIFTKKIIPSPIYELYKEDIEEYTKRLQVATDIVERVKAKEKIMEYTVDIPAYEWARYSKAQRNRLAETFPSIPLEYKEELPIMECIYDELGFQRMDYETTIREANVF